MIDDYVNIKNDEVKTHEPKQGEALTPMMRQYRRGKAEIDGGVVLMFRLGDF